MNTINYEKNKKRKLKDSMIGINRGEINISY